MQSLCYAFVRMPLRALLVGLVLTLDRQSGWSLQGCRADAQPTRPIVILISIDGWRWDYLDLFTPPTMGRLATAGVRAEGLIPVFPSKTFPNHYSIVTGQYPTRHGILSNNMVDAGPARALHARQARSWVQQDTRWWGGEPLWITAERQGQITATMFWPGSDVEIAGRRPRTGGCSTTMCPTRRALIKCSSG